MAHIRTVKPEYFRNIELYQLELRVNRSKTPANYANVRLAFMALWGAADREGRFKWKPHELKLDCLPYDAVDFGEIMDALAAGEKPFIIRYEINGRAYGVIPGFKSHQIPHHTEAPSEIPDMEGHLTDLGHYPTGTLRRSIYRRDGYRCLYCDEDLAQKPKAVCLDHVVPYSRGGTHYEKNLATSCKRCNAQKGERTPEEAGMKWPHGLGQKIGDTTANSLTPLTGGRENALTPHWVAGVERKGKEGNKERSKEGKGDKAAAVIPEDLKAIEAEVNDWLIYKRERGEAYKPKGLEALWRRLREIPEDRRAAAIERSMASNWAGIFPEKGGIDGKISSGSRGSGRGSAEKAERADALKTATRRIPV